MMLRVLLAWWFITSSVIHYEAVVTQVHGPFESLRACKEMTAVWLQKKRAFEKVVEDCFAP
jgi:hypothetical protein